MSSGFSILEKVQTQSEESGAGKLLAFMFLFYHDNCVEVRTDKTALKNTVRYLIYSAKNAKI